MSNFNSNYIIHPYYNQIKDSTRAYNQYVFEKAGKAKLEYTKASELKDWLDPNTECNKIPKWLYLGLQNPNEDLKSPVPWQIVDEKDFEIQYPVHCSEFTAKAIKKQGTLYFYMHMNLEVTKIYLNLPEILKPVEMTVSFYGNEMYTLFPNNTFDKNVYAFDVPNTNFSRIDSPAKCKLKYTSNSWFNIDGNCLIEYCFRSNNVLRRINGLTKIGFSF